jgi:hypothetical protein
MELLAGEMLVELATCALKGALERKKLYNFFFQKP